jgi:Periplasmic binding protein-like domain
VARVAGFGIPRETELVREGVPRIDDLATASEAAVPPLVTGRQPIRQMMEIAFDMLVGRVQGQRAGTPNHTMLPPQLVVRGSTAQAPSPRPPAATERRGGVLL